MSRNDASNPFPSYTRAYVADRYQCHVTTCHSVTNAQGPTMTDETDKPSQALTTQQQAAVGKTTRNGVSGRLKAALDDMTWNGTPWEEAARKANLTVRAM